MEDMHGAVGQVATASTFLILKPGQRGADEMSRRPRRQSFVLLCRLRKQTARVRALVNHRVFSSSSNKHLKTFRRGLQSSTVQRQQCPEDYLRDLKHPVIAQQSAFSLRPLNGTIKFHIGPTGAAGTRERGHLSDSCQ